MPERKLLLAYYGDDFTGSTDALEVLSKAGAKTVLFISPPKPEQLERFPDLQAIGVAGMTRSMVPADMENELLSSFTSLKKLGAPHVHYKVCSTFDSSPAIGSIGKAIDTGARVFDSSFVPLLVAVPALGRYCLFGNLFARMGIGSNGSIYRLDRHPSMSRHPITPADESDLRMHLSKQTAKSIRLVDILQLSLPEKKLKVLLEDHVKAGAEIILFDALYEEQMAGIGKLIDSYGSTKNPLFSVGSSGIETALSDHWRKKKKLIPKTEWQHPGKARQLLVVSGSCSLVNSKQITRAVSRGFKDLPIDTEAIASEGLNAAVIKDHIRQTATLINEGKNVILHTSNGDNDTRVAKTMALFKEKGLDEINIRAKTAELYGTALGEIAKAVAAQTSLQRIVIAGGDTSGHVARALGIDAVEMIASLSPGAPLCKAYAHESPIDGMEVVFKGGQVGDDNYFEMVLNGKRW